MLYNDHLGNVREVWKPSGDSTETVQRTRYYPSGLPWEYQVGDSASLQPYKFNGCEFIETHGYDVTDLGNRGVYHAINRFTSMDRFAEKYPWQSPYVHAGNNPVNFMDVGGDSIWISYTDENGQQRILYTQGMEYRGENSTVAHFVSVLNAMNSTQNGELVLTALSSSQNNFNITRGKSEDGTAGFKPKSAGGGDLLMGNSDDLLSTAHEMFHAYQHEHGQGGRSIFNELEAYLFSDGVNFEYHSNYTGAPAGSYSQGQSLNEEAIKFSNSVSELRYSPFFIEQSFNTAVNLFKRNSGANINGQYDHYPLRKNNQTNNLIKCFYPLFK